MFHPNFYSGDLTLRRISSAPAPMFAPQTPPPQQGAIVRGVVTEHKLPMLHGYLDNNRGIGLADMAYALRNGRKPRLHGELGYHAWKSFMAFWKAAAPEKSMSDPLRAPAMIKAAAWWRRRRKYAGLIVKGALPSYAFAMVAAMAASAVTGRAGCVGTQV
jgi:hypothetical protein